MTDRSTFRAAPHRKIRSLAWLLVLLFLPTRPLPVLARPAPGVSYDPGRLVPSLYARRDPYIFTHNTGLLTLQLTNL
ncbi:MAG: hypothetical protein FD129_356, partial [bacterium]